MGLHHPEEPLACFARRAGWNLRTQTNRALQVYVIQNEIPEAVVLFSSTTHVLHVPASDKYALSRQQYLFNLNYVTQVCLLPRTEDVLKLLGANQIVHPSDPCTITEYYGFMFQCCSKSLCPNCDQLPFPVIKKRPPVLGINKC